MAAFSHAVDQQSMASLVQTCPPVKAELQLEVPERYCSLDITSCGKCPLVGRHDVLTSALHWLLI